ncbi:MAG: HAD-IIA family hydrolase [Saccharofermentanales bacterium]
MLVYSSIPDKKIEKRIKDIKCWLIDMDGTISLGEELLPGADRFFHALTDQRFIFVTNNSSHSADHYVKRMNRIGVPTKRENVLTSTDALILYIKERFSAPENIFSYDMSFNAEGIVMDTFPVVDHEPQNEKTGETGGSAEPDDQPVKVFPVGTPDFEMELKDAGLRLVKNKNEDIDAVLLGFDSTLTYEKLDIACDYIRRGVPYFVANPDKVCPLAEGKVMPDCGAIMSFMQTCTGIMPEKIIGKPDPAMIDIVISLYGYSRDEIAMVGDRIYTDMSFAKNAGILCVAVLTGEASFDDIITSEVDPDLVFDSIVDIADYLSKSSL